MKKKRILIILAVIVALVVPFSVFAATSDTPAAKSVRGFFGMDMSKLTDKQKADITDFNKKAAQLKKDFINQMVADGAMTKEQGDAAIKKIDDALNSSGKNSIMPDFGMGKNGFMGHGKPDGSGNVKIDTSKLTDQQKKDLTDSYKSMAGLQKDLAGKMVSNGLLTKDQGDLATKKIDKMVNSLDSNGISNTIGMAVSDFGGLSWLCRGTDTSKLTDGQKADLTDYFRKMAVLKKDFVNKMSTYGLISSEQKDTLTQKIDNMEKSFEQNGFSKVFGSKGGKMMKGHFGRGGGSPDGFRGKQGNPVDGSSKAPAT